MNSFYVCAASAQQKRAQLGGVQRFAFTSAHEASICLLHVLMYSFCHIQKQRTNRALSLPLISSARLPMQVLKVLSRILGPKKAKAPWSQSH